MSDIYCDEIVPGSRKVEVVYETDNVLAFKHTRPYYEVHIVIISKQHIDSLTSQIPSELMVELIQVVSKIARKIEREFGGCRVSTNVGDYQTSKHLHFYIHSGKRIRD